MVFFLFILSKGAYSILLIIKVSIQLGIRKEVTGIARNVISLARV